MKLEKKNSKKKKKKPEPIRLTYQTYDLCHESEITR
jgi:hypothetical protein